MDEQFVKRLSAAVRAAWWTILIFVVWMLLGWVDILWILHARPDWILRAWGGGDLTWTEVHTLVLWTFGIMKLLLFVALMVTVWLSLWVRRLKRL